MPEITSVGTVLKVIPVELFHFLDGSCAIAQMDKVDKIAI